MFTSLRNYCNSLLVGDTDDRASISTNLTDTVFPQLKCLLSLAKVVRHQVTESHLPLIRSYNTSIRCFCDYQLFSGIF